MNDEQTTPKETSLRDEFLNSMRYVANSVTVVTTDGPAGKSGATVSAFSSLSADPPSVLVCLNLESNTLEALRENKHFCVNVLPEGARHIAERFAGFHDDEIEDRFSNIDIITTGDPSPAISGATSFTCDLEQMVESGSHVICIGRVIETHAGNFTPLIYMDRKYKRLSDYET